LNRKIVGFILFLFSHVVVFSQSITGEWYGVGVVKRKEVNSDYLSELILRQRGRIVTGEFNYFFKSVTINSKITGTYDPATRLLKLKMQPLLNFKASDINGADCPMEGIFTLQISRVETSLKGEFKPSNDYRLTCPAISVKFIKDVENPNETKPEQSKTAERTPEKIPETSVDKPDKIAEAAVIGLFVDSVKPEPEKELLTELNRRTFEASPVIEVSSDSLRLALYDNGDVDGDTISVFYNRTLIAAHQQLSTRAFNIVVPIDTNIHEISMLAENLGTIPPNTALCVIYAGEQRFELSLSSSYIKNATLRFRKKPVANTEKKP